MEGHLVRACPNQAGPDVMDLAGGCCRGDYGAGMSFLLGTPAMRGRPLVLGKNRAMKKREVKKNNNCVEVEEMEEDELKETGTSGRWGGEIGQVEKSGEVVSTTEVRGAGEMRETGEVGESGEVGDTSEEKSKEI